MFNLKNRYLVWRFPYLRPRKYDGTIIPDYDYKFTDLDCYPDGWRKLIIGYCKRLNKILKRYGELHNFYITDAKEKWGTARLYYSGVSNGDCRRQIDELLFKLETESWHVCSICGKKATYASQGYVMPYCYECTKNPKIFTCYEPIEEPKDE